MNMRNTISRSAVAMMLAAGAQLVAQEQTGTLSGLILGPGEKPIAGVRITIESPALFSPRTVLSNEKGEWRVPILPVGNYSIKAVKDGFGAPSYKDVRVGVASNQRLDFTLRRVIEATALVEVSAPMLTMSASEVKVATNISGEQLWRLPVVASGGGGIFEQARIMSPGVVTDNNNSKNGIRGVSADAIGYFMDGMDVKDNGTAAFSPIPDFVEDVLVVQSPVNAASGRVSGGQVKVVTKSGGNEFAGSVRITYNRASERAGWFASDATNTATSSTDKIARTWNLTLSGPLWKDHIWFSVANQRIAGSNSIIPLFPASGTPNNASFPVMPQANVGGTGYPFEAYLTNLAARLRALPSGTTIPRWDIGTNIPSVGDSSFWDTKFTAALFGDHVISLSTSYRRSSTSATAADFTGFTQYWIQARDFGPGTNLRKAYSINYRGSITPNFQVEAQQGAYRYQATSYAVPDGNNPVKVYSGLSNGTFGTGYSTFGAFPLFGTNGQNQTRSNLNQSLRFKYLADWKGSHEVDFGLENVAMHNNPGYPQPGNLTRVGVGGYYVDSSTGAYSFPTVRFVGPTLNGQQSSTTPTLISGDAFTRVGPAPLLLNFWAGGGDMVDRTRVIYVNDTWTPNQNWTITAGLRFNRFSVENTDGSSVLSTNMPEPRFQAKWNPDGKGVHAFAFTLARYAQEFTTSGTSPWVIAPNTAFTVRGWAGIAGQPLPGDPTDGGNYGVRNVSYAQLTDPANYLATHYYRDARQQLSIDPNLKAAYGDEIALNYRRSLEGGYVNLALAQRTYKNALLSSLDYGLENFQVVKDPSGQGAPSKRIQLTRYLNSPFETKFRTLELSWQQAVTSRLTFVGSYTYFRQTGVQESGVLNNLSLRNNTAFGLTAQERVPAGLLLDMQKAKVAWTYAHPIKGGEIAVTLLGDYLHDPGVGALGTSMLYRYIKDGSGNVVLQPMPTLDPNGLAVQAIGDPSFSRYYSPMGAYRNSNDTYSASLKVDWKIPFGVSRAQLIGSLQIINIFNQGMNFQPPYSGTAAGTTDGIPGRLMYTQVYVPGSAGTLTGTSERSMWNQPRTFSEITMGLRF